ncbi:beta/alpha barrel domain-containing protein [Priestia flexa]|uniref:hypothetical protein n=1 Tax=Priestia flexa TaxID=86664 RepID=UPI001CD654D1|nr:hypothetical protein [Priestia flexa]MCA1202280.1 hypothetical protein [Priestia flexa]
MFKILDCTLRDGGYYTDWDFNANLVDLYLETMSTLPVDIIELGYRSVSKDSYFGEYFYLPLKTIQKARKKLNNSQEIAVMVNSKDVASKHELEVILRDCIGLVDMVRFAAAPTNINHTMKLANAAKALGFKVALNVMYLSKLTDEELNSLSAIDDINGLDYLYLVDSYGSCYPTDISKKFNLLQDLNPNIKYGFHGHDNMELAFANTIESINSGVSIVDSTLTGMGRGAGNLKTELISIYKSNQSNSPMMFDNLVNLVDEFNLLKQDYKWGASLPYIIAGIRGLPQNKVMQLMSKQRYSTLSIIESLEDSHKNISKIKDYGEFELSGMEHKFNSVIIIGGGKELFNHINSIKEFALCNNSLIINSSVKNYEIFEKSHLKQLVCLPGDEKNKIDIINTQSPNLLGFIFTEKTLNAVDFNENVSKIYKIDILSDLKNSANEIDEDAPLAMAISAAQELGIKEIYLAGFDGYRGITSKENYLSIENQMIIDNYNSLYRENKLQTITPSLYKVDRLSMYDLLSKPQRIDNKKVTV